MSYIYSQMVACGKRIKEKALLTLTQLKLWTPKQEPLDILEVVQKSASLAVVSPTYERKKHTTKPRVRKCLRTDKLCRSERAAKRRARSMGLRAYKCEFCPYWHLTHVKNKLRLH